MPANFFLLFILLLINSITSFVYAQQSATNAKVNTRQLNNAKFSLLNLSATDDLGRSFNAASASQQHTRYVGLF